MPDLGTYVTHIVQLKYTKPSEMVQVIQPFAKLQNSILPIDSNGILVLRDNAENVKRMLQMIERVDVSVPAEYISEVIPIKYALAEDIASALNSLGGSGGGSTVSIGGSTSGTKTGTTTRTGTTGTTGGNGFNTQQRGTTGTTGVWRRWRVWRWWFRGNGQWHAGRWRHIDIPAAVAGHHPTCVGNRRAAGSNPGFRPDENHRRPAEQFAFDFCDAGGHGTNQGGGGET